MREVRKYGISALFFMVIVLCLSALSNAKSVNKILLAEQAKGKAPYAKVYITGTEMSADVSVSGITEGIAFSQEGDIKTFSETGESLRYVILLDNSNSMNKDQYLEVIEQLKNLRKNLKNSDELLLYTVGTLKVDGECTDVFKRVVKAEEADKIDSDIEMIDSIPFISGREAKTILYRSLNHILEQQSAQSVYDSARTVVLLITDGEDDSDDISGRDNDKDATLENVKNSSIPVYGILINNCLSEPNLDKIKFTKDKILDSDNCKGYYYNCNSEPTADIVEKAFKKIDKILREETFVVNLRADNNKALPGKTSLELTVNNQAISPVTIDYNDFETDPDAPVISSDVEKTGKNTLEFSIEDPNGLNFDDLSDASHYSVIMDVDDDKTKNWVINQVNVSGEKDQATIVLTMEKDDLYNGDYTLTVDGIRDTSNEENTMKGVEKTFTVEDGLDGKKEARKEFIQKYWWIALIILILVIGVIIILIAKKRAIKIIKKGVDVDALNKADTRFIRLTTKTEGGIPDDIMVNVEGSMFVGRSEICNLYFDDAKLSKQHFVIGVTGMGCYIEDLESTNGTFVNGVRLTERRMLFEGDVITAGREEFVFHLMDEPKEDSEEEEEK